MWIYRKFKEKLPFWFVRVYFGYMSWRNRIKSKSVQDKIVLSRPYCGEKILLMALYQKGCIRDDVLIALEAAKKQGVYVVCVNTLKLQEPDAYIDKIDCYIERYNFGRDFGSYKSGFEWLYSSGYEKSCSRMLMMNDSVFYSKKHIDKFISDLIDTDCDALGATENYEIEHHLGSFCLSLSNHVISDDGFKRYWNEYVDSDVRPVVIKNGEMGLSKVLRSVVRVPEGFRALYDVTRVVKELSVDSSLLESIPEMTRRSHLPWECFSFCKVTENIKNKFLFSSASLVGVAAEVDCDFHYVNSVSSYTNFISGVVGDVDSIKDSLEFSVRNEVVAEFVNGFVRGSQIHQNNIFLHNMGLAIIKLDGVYRGVFIAQDVERIAADLDEGQKENFQRIMYSRPYGGDVNFGWKGIAFKYGLI